MRPIPRSEGAVRKDAGVLQYLAKAHEDSQPDASVPHRCRAGWTSLLRCRSPVSRMSPDCCEAACGEEESCAQHGTYVSTLVQRHDRSSSAPHGHHHKAIALCTSSLLLTDPLHLRPTQALLAHQALQSHAPLAPDPARHRRHQPHHEQQAQQQRWVLRQDQRPQAAVWCYRSCSTIRPIVRNDVN